ncbi:MAG TPA: SDR family NAD(P)-dependent oxidoreductase [Mycobacteriales bacterium]|nr:SDR family NAD(P)-dependent oxidoreductase [Mycobacteriales bacterium]
MEVMEMDLDGRRALITGGSRGIGLAIARALTAEGVAVALCARGEAELTAAVESLVAAGGRAVGIRADVADPADLAGAVERAATALGGLDLLVANAGGATGGRLLDSTPADWTATFGLNVLHAAHAVRVAVPHLAAGESPAVLLVSSLSGHRPGSRSSYTTAKAAVSRLAPALADELGGHGIRVNAISPGSTLAPGNVWDRMRVEQPEEFARFAAEEFAGGRLVTADEVADVACFLLSPRAAGVNGADVAVDGGQQRPGPRRPR